MNFPLGSRLQQTIRNIEHRNVRGPVQAPVPVVHQSRIPKTAAYYLKKKQEANPANEPYLNAILLDLSDNQIKGIIYEIREVTIKNCTM